MAEIIFILMFGIFVAYITRRLMAIVKKDLNAEKLGWRVETICFGAAAVIPVLFVSILNLGYKLVIWILAIM